MNLTKELKEELKALSKEVFGSSGRYEKILKNGMPELITTTKVETVPGENGAEATTKEVKIPVLTKQGTRQFAIKYYEPEELKTHMLEAKQKIDDFKVQMQKMQEEQQKRQEEQKLINKINEEAKGSAI